jgi:uncharacterized protein YwgA
MTKLKRAALVAALADKLLEKGSWSGETHLQKSIYLLQEMLHVPLDYEYVLYKHGPFSFELRDELAEMRANEVLTMVPQLRPYGPRLFTGDGAAQLRRRFPKTIQKYDAQLEYIAEEVGAEGVTALERLATAFWATANEHGSAAERAGFIHELKPHISINAAEKALERVQELQAAAPVAA